MTINYVIGDATEPIGDGPKIIAHIVNNKNAWGKGFVVPLGKKYPRAEQSYHHWFDVDPKYAKAELGKVQFVDVGKSGWFDCELFVANMMAQDGYRKQYGDSPKQFVDYEALALCLARVRNFAIDREASIHGPRFGAGLGGGDWSKIETLINEIVTPFIPVTIYDLA